MLVVFVLTLRVISGRWPASEARICTLEREIFGKCFTHKNCPHKDVCTHFPGHSDWADCISEPKTIYCDKPCNCDPGKFGPKIVRADSCRYYTIIQENDDTRNLCPGCHKPHLWPDNELKDPDQNVWDYLDGTQISRVNNDRTDS